MLFLFMAVFAADNPFDMADTPSSAALDIVYLFIKRNISSC
jgi:hypothetical protein